MKTVLTFTTETGQFDIKLTNDEVRFFIKAEGVRRVVIARFTYDEINTLRRKNKLNHTKAERMSDFYSVDKTVLNDNVFRLDVYYYSGEHSIHFTSFQWQCIRQTLIGIKNLL